MNIDTVKALLWPWFKWSPWTVVRAKNKERLQKALRYRDWQLIEADRFEDLAARASVEAANCRALAAMYNQRIAAIQRTEGHLPCA